MDNKLSGIIPNAFYDLIVFASSTVLFAGGMFFGLGQHHAEWYKQLGTGNVVLIFAGLLFLSYEYGRIAEAWSAALVQRPLKFLRDHTRLMKNEDFLAPLDKVEGALGLDATKSLRNGGKWAVYFYAMAVNPKLGTDLLKRYAWEKLSRNSAFTFCLLSAISIAAYVADLLPGVDVPLKGGWTFGSLEYSAIVCLMTVVTYAEYYQRNCWNNDLLERVIPVLAKAADLAKTE